MTGATAAELSLHIGASEGEPERLLLIGRPSAGRVQVREWDGGNWGGPSRTRERPAADLYAAIERAARHRASLSVELYRVKLWLDGRAT